MNRRAMLGSLLGAVFTGPLAVDAQPPERVRVIGVLMPLSKNDPEAQTRVKTFQEALQRLGWVEGQNVRFDTRWTEGNAAETRKHAADLARLSPEVILAAGSATAGPALDASRTVPIVFVQVPDPVGAGFVDSLARPGGNATGFVQFEYSLSGKWLELLKQAAPGLVRAAIIRDPAISAGTGQFGAIQLAASSLAVEVSPVNVRDATEIVRAIEGVASSPNIGLIVTGSALAVIHRDLIISLAARHKLPAVYFERHFATAGGLISYGPDLVDQYRRAAGYVDRILKGEKTSDLPVLAPNKYQLVINLKTAKTLDLTVPQALLAHADEVIE